VIEVVNDYFPDWLVNIVSTDMENMPVTYSNSPYADFNRARFFGNMLMQDDKHLQQPWWFLEYFNRCIYNDICIKYNVNRCARILLNAQLPGMDGCNHNDSDNDNYLSVIYMGHGNSGDTVFVNQADEDIERVTFKEGRLVIFNSAIYHRGEAPTQGYRCTLGAVYPLNNESKS
tara:strand:+ start:955 stop:1476 length:522 start_codon:yes stop_codon:yes gene_type:complete